jgi:hypothetical protein
MAKTIEQFQIEIKEIEDTISDQDTPEELKGDLEATLTSLKSQLDVEEKRISDEAEAERLRIEAEALAATEAAIKEKEEADRIESENRAKELEEQEKIRQQEERKKKMLRFGEKTIEEASIEELELAIRKRIRIAETNPGKRTKSILSAPIVTE